MNKKLMSLCLVVVFFMVTGNAFAKWGRCQGMNGGGFLRSIYSLPDLTDEQRISITNIKDAFHTDILPLKEEMAQKHIELNNILKEENIDSEKAFAKQEEIFEVNRKLGKKALSYQINVIEQLTPEQISNSNFTSCRMMCGPSGKCRGQQMGCSGKNWKGCMKGAGNKMPRGQCPMMQSQN